MKPATPLPWEVNSPALARVQSVGGIADKDAAYIVHAANELPKLESRVGELLQICARAEEDVRRLAEDRRKLVEALRNIAAQDPNRIRETGNIARAALSELGEDFS